MAFLVHFCVPLSLSGALLLLCRSAPLLNPCLFLICLFCILLSTWLVGLGLSCPFLCPAFLVWRSFFTLPLSPTSAPLCFLDLSLLYLAFYFVVGGAFFACFAVAVPLMQPRCSALVLLFLCCGAGFAFHLCAAFFCLCAWLL